MQVLKKESKRKVVSQFELTSDLITKLNNFKITPTAKLVLLYLTTCYNPKHKEVFPKQKTIADKLGVSEVSVTRAIQELHKEGLILSERKISKKYVFTSRIVSEQPNKMINDNLQKDSEETINLIESHVIEEQTKRTKKEQTLKSGENVYKGDDLILYEYAKTRAKYSVDAFIQKIKENGGADKIIRDFKKKPNNFELALRKTEILGQIREQAKQESVTPENCTAWVEFGKKYGIKK